MAASIWRIRCAARRGGVAWSLAEGPARSGVDRRRITSEHFQIEQGACPRLCRADDLRTLLARLGKDNHERS